MKRPAFDRRIPLFIVIGGTFAVLLALGGFNLSLRGLSQPVSAPQQAFPVEERAAAGLTWVLTLSIDQSEVQARLTSAEGIPVSGGRGRLTLARKDGAQLELPLHERDAGLYVVTLPEGLGARVHARIHIAQQESHIARALLIAY